MSGKADGGVPVTFADGVRDDVASLAASADDEASASELAALKRRIAELLVECKANPYLGENDGAQGGIPSLPAAGGSDSTSRRTAASRASGSSTATSHPTGRRPSVAGSRSRLVRGCERTGGRANARGMERERTVSRQRSSRNARSGLAGLRDDFHCTIGAGTGINCVLLRARC